MNKVMLMGRLTKDPEVRYSQSAEPVAIARYTIAVNRRFKRDGEPDADFINVVAFGKNGEFAEKYFQKGQQVAVVGHIQVNSYDDKDGNRRWSTDVIVEEQHFAESKRSFEENRSRFDGQTQYSEAPQPVKAADGFVPINQEFDDDDDLPF